MSAQLTAGPFRIDVENRNYDQHRPKGCTVVTIEVDWWPGNEFGFWLPETVSLNYRLTDSGVVAPETMTASCAACTARPSRLRSSRPVRAGSRKASSSSFRATTRRS